MSLDLTLRSEVSEPLTAVQHDANLQAIQDAINALQSAPPPTTTAEALGTTGADVTIGGAAPPTTGQVLTATGATTATWQTPSYETQTGFTGATNTAYGVNAAVSITTGVDNTAVGKSALHGNLDGQANTVIGREAMYTNTSGTGNVAVGVIALAFNTSGVNAVAVGNNALVANTTASGNVAVGSSALASVTIWGGNTAVGSSALIANNGANNTAVGGTSGAGVTSGTNNVFIGQGSGVDAGGGAAGNRIAIGQGAICSADNFVQLGNGSTTGGKIGTKTIATTDILTPGLFPLASYQTSPPSKFNSFTNLTGSNTVTWAPSQLVGKSYALISVDIQPISATTTGLASMGVEVQMTRSDTHSLVSRMAGHFLGNSSVVHPATFGSEQMMIVPVVDDTLEWIVNVQTAGTMSAVSYSVTVRLHAAQ